MKQDHLKQMYGSTPESFRHRIAFALKETEAKTMKRKFIARTVFIVCAILVLMTAVACAAFPSQVTAFFGRLYGNGMQAWLEKGDMAAVNKSFVLDEVEFTLDEVVYRDNGLYGVGTIRPREGSKAVIIPEDHTPDEPYGYDIRGEGGTPEKAPAGAPSIADITREKGGKLLQVRTLPDKIGVDGGEMLAPGCVGYTLAPQRDGSVRFSFEVPDVISVEEGEMYTIQMWASVCEMTANSETLTDTRHGENWTVDIKPVPISDASPVTAVPVEPETTPAPAGEVSLATAGPTVSAQFAEPEIIMPEEYTQNGTLPVLRATERDFAGGLQPELFNQSGVASRDEGKIVFKDEAFLQFGSEALFYWENSGTFNASAGTEYEADICPRPALSDAIARLASWTMIGWPGDSTEYQLEKFALTDITLNEAKKVLETLLDRLGVTGYTCDYALDMSVERIKALGSNMNAMITSGKYFTNLPQYDFSQVSAADEGFYLSYHKPSDGRNLGNGDIFSVYAYVTSRGVVRASIRDAYIPGDVYDSPDSLVDPEKILAKLPGEVAASRFPGKVVSISSIRLTYSQMRAANKADGMVLSPVWLVIYQDEEAEKKNYDCWAEFDAVNGKLLNAIFK
jgi:hypothetical protein